MVCGWRQRAPGPALEAHPLVVRQPADLLGHRRAPPRLRLLAEGDARARWCKGLRLYGEMHRFIPAVASWMGVTLAEVPVNHRPRTRGRSKYGLGRTLRVLLDLFTVKFLLAYGTRPAHLFGLMGLASRRRGLRDPRLPRRASSSFQDRPSAAGRCCCWARCCS